MGLFGLFATMFGLGAMTKDVIDDNISNNQSRQRADLSRNPTYLGCDGKKYSTKTGRRATEKIDNDTGITWLVDSQTGAKIENLTEYYIARKNEKSRIEALQNGNVFYRIADYDINVRGGCCDIYASTSIPGYFKKTEKTYNGGYHYKTYLYKKGVIGDHNIRTYHVKIDGISKWLPMKTVIISDDSDTYFPDGTKYSEDEFIRRRNEYSKSIAIKRGDKFYNTNRFDHYRSVDNDFPYVYNNNQRSFTPARITATTKQERIRPHHKETRTLIIETWTPIDGAEKFNLDGTKWIP